MPKRVELLPKAEMGRAYALVDDDRVEIHVSGILGALKAWLVGGENKPIGNIVNGRLTRETDTSMHSGILITQSGRQMFYGSWAEEPEAGPPQPPEVPLPELPTEQEKAENTAEIYAPLPDFGWEKITGREYPSTDDRVRFALSTRAFFEVFKEQGYYLFGRDGERFALAIKRAGVQSPFPGLKAAEAGEYVYVVL